MSKFILDTSGRVAIHGRRAIPNPAEFVAWEHLDAFTQGYIEALFMASHDGLDGEWCALDGGFDVAKGFADLAPDALARIIEDCRAWMGANDQTLGLAMGASHGGGGWERKAGRDFWLSRTDEALHDVGFPDGGWPRPYREALHAASVAFGHVAASLGEDGKIHLS